MRGWWRKWKFNLCLSCVSPLNIHVLHYNPLFKQCLQGWRDCSPCLFNRKFAILGPTTALLTGHQSNSISSNAPQIISFFIQDLPNICSLWFLLSPKHHNSDSTKSCLKKQQWQQLWGQMLNISCTDSWSPVRWQKATIIILWLIKLVPLLQTDIGIWLCRELLAELIKEQQKQPSLSVLHQWSLTSPHRLQ